MSSSKTCILLGLAGLAIVGGVAAQTTTSTPMPHWEIHVDPWWGVSVQEYRVSVTRSFIHSNKFYIWTTCSSII